MSTTLVSILSKYSMPNFLFIKEMEGHYDELIFITTPQADKDNRGFQLQNALGITDEKIVYISVDGNDYHKTITILQEWNCPKDNKYIVNLTGGTKMMSLAVHDYFQELNTTFFYVPINENSYNNLSDGSWTPIKYRATLKEYFALYGIKYTCNNKLTYDKEHTKELFNKLKLRKFWLPNKLIHANEDGVWKTPEDKRYYSGGWFEEYTYTRIKDQYRLRDEDIALSLKIFGSKAKATNDNELDVAFVLNNALYVIECKVTMNGYKADASKTIETYLYKLAAISNNYGLVVNPYLFTLHNLSQLSSGTRHNLDKRCKILKIRGIIGQEELLKEKLEL